MQSLASLCESISRTTKKTEKIALVSNFFRRNTVDDSARAAIFLSGRTFPAFEEATLNVGGALLSRVLLEVTHATDHQLGLAYRRHGDLGSAALDLFTEKNLNAGAPSVAQPQVGIAASVSITLQELATKFRAIAAASGAAKKADIIRDLFERATPLEAKYLVKFMGGDLRIGLRESLVEEAIAKAYGEDYAQVRRANMLMGDISAALRLAAEHRLTEAHMRLFHPIGLMLATAIENSTEALQYFKDANIQIEDKYDGIRAQVHVGPDPDSDAKRVRIFSRTMDDITESFPELAESLRTFPFPSPVIIDGEILAWDTAGGDSSGSETLDTSGAPSVAKPQVGERETQDSSTENGRPTLVARPLERQGGNNIGRALPFSRLQQRLGRKNPSAQLMREAPVAYVAFDVLYANGELVIEKPLHERGTILDRLFSGHAENLRGSFFVPPLAATKAATRSRAATTRHSQQYLFEPADSLLATATEDNNSIPLSAVLRAPTFHADSPEDLDALFDSAQARGNEGLMIKDLDSPYTPGRRGKSWLKLKRELATLDVVVTAVEYGHGKRAAVLSDVTFAVRDTSPDSDPNFPGPNSEDSSSKRVPHVARPERSRMGEANVGSDRLLNVGKAYSGLTDLEIAELTEWFKQHTISDYGHRLLVEPSIVLEVAFNNVMVSDRHESGYALRFPRILRLRPDKPISEIDTVGRVREIYEKQHVGLSS